MFANNEIEKAYANLKRLSDLYENVCDVAWGDDNKEPPSWDEVWKECLSDWGEIMDVEFWTQYMLGSMRYGIMDLVYYVEKEKSKGNCLTQSDIQAEDKET